MSTFRELFERRTNMSNPYTDIALKKIVEQELNKVLEDIKTEIKETRDRWEKDGYYDEADALNIALKIIDKHIGKENE